MRISIGLLMAMLAFVAQAETPDPMALKAQLHFDGFVLHCGHSARLRGCSMCSAHSTPNENSTMAPASQCAWVYSMASTWS